MSDARTFDQVDDAIRRVERCRDRRHRHAAERYSAVNDEVGWARCRCGAVIFAWHMDGGDEFEIDEQADWWIGIPPAVEPYEGGYADEPMVGDVPLQWGPLPAVDVEDPGADDRQARAAKRADRDERTAIEECLRAAG